MIFDTHTHYDDEQFNEDRETLLAHLQDNGIGTIVNVKAAKIPLNWRKNILLSMQP